MDKEQIIIDGVNLSNIRLYLETGHRSSVSTKEFEKIIDLLERKTQEYTDLKEDYNELEQRHNEAFQEFERLKKECEELKAENKRLVGTIANHVFDGFEELDRYRKALAPFQDEYFKGLDTTAIAELAKKSIRLTTENRKLETALDEIEEMLQVIVKSNKVYPLQSNLYKILNIISKAKGEE